MSPTGTWGTQIHFNDQYLGQPPGLFDFGDAALGGIFLELQGVVARDNSVRIATGQLDHAFLVLNIGGVIRIRKGSAGFVFGEIAIEIAIVGCQDEGRIAVDAQYCEA